MRKVKNDICAKKKVETRFSRRISKMSWGRSWRMGKIAYYKKTDNYRLQVATNKIVANLAIILLLCDD